LNEVMAEGEKDGEESKGGAMAAEMGSTKRPGGSAGKKGKVSSDDANEGSSKGGGIPSGYQILPGTVAVQIQTMGVGGVHKVQVPRKRLASLDSLAKALQKVLPAGSAPSASELAERFKMKVSRSGEGGEREKLNPQDAAAMSALVEEAHAMLYVWPRKEK
jgi:hypothetical protein